MTHAVSAVVGLGVASEDRRVELATARDKSIMGRMTLEQSTMTRATRVFMMIEAGTFCLAATIHFGRLMAGYGHRKAGIAESVIAFVLPVGLAFAWIRATSTRIVGLVAQWFALLATLVGIFTIAIGVGPRTAPDIAYHVGIVIVLVCGLIVAAQAT